MPTLRKLIRVRLSTPKLVHLRRILLLSMQLLLSKLKVKEATSREMLHISLKEKHPLTVKDLSKSKNKTLNRMLAIKSGLISTSSA